MLYSMTGYGKAKKEFASQSVSAEVKSLNSKGFDLRTRIPLQYQPKDILIRKLLRTKVMRGKVDFYLNVTSTTDAEHQINNKAFEYYYDQLAQLASKNGFTPDNILYTVTRMPNVIVPNEEEVSEDSWKEVLSVIHEAIEAFTAFRTEEGEVLAKDIEMRIQLIEKLLGEVEPHEAERLKKVKERVYNNLEQGRLNGKIDENRFEQEMIYYLDKLDITEEKVRLKQHCTYFLDAMKKDEKTKGKKLNFILQEIGREINTLGAKANSAALQRIVIQMKDEADKIKEQLANIM